MRARPLRVVLAIGVGLVLAAGVLEAALRALAVAAPEERSIVPRAGSATVLCVGDSHTFGLFVEASESYPARLERLLDDSGVLVVNAGRPAINSTLLVPHARTWTARVGPKCLVVRVGLNDFWNVARPDDSLLASLRIVRLFRLLRSRAGASEGGEPADRRLPTAPMETTLGRLGEVVRVRADLERNLRAVLAGARESGAVPLVLAYSLDAHYYAVVNEALRDAAAEAGATFVDPTAEARRRVRAGGFPSIYLPDFHPNARGYALEASLVAEAVRAALGAGASPADLPLPAAPTDPEATLRDLEAGYDALQKTALLLRHNPGAEALGLLRGQGARILDALAHPSVEKTLPSALRASIEAAARSFDAAAERGDAEGAARAVASFPGSLRAPR
ncbi:MAG: SGNH/GDSL hydrolase family protein [Planctomycetes bacterium]|nr:SGNH/GDSL hydrolase family protein [Planctomycetota bacterium]